MLSKSQKLFGIGFDPDEIAHRYENMSLDENDRDIPGDSSAGLAARVVEAHKCGQVEYTAVQDSHSEVVTDPAYAEEMLKHHQDLDRSVLLARAIYKAMLGKGGGDLKQVRMDLERNGGFFEPMSVDDCENRLNDPDHWVVTRAGGKILDPRSVEWRDFRYVAGMQVQLPSDDPRAPLVTKIPDPEKDGKAFYEGRNRQSALTVAKKIHENHAIAGCIDEVGVWPPEYRRKGLASMARQASFRHIREVINPTRKNAIRVLVANMFNIRGMVVRNPEMQKPRAMLKNDKGKVESVRNQPSIDMHAFSTKIKSIITWNIAKDTIPVLFDYEGESVSAELLVGWDTVVMKV